MSATKLTPRRNTRKKAQNTVKIVSYNVLSSHLAGASHFTSCNPDFLGESYRYEGLETKLEAEIEKGAVICLQEVSHLWAGRLHVFFAAHRYHFINVHYGGKFNGYMGVAIAVPLDVYEIVDVDITRIVDTKRMPKPPISNWFASLCLAAWAFVLSLWQALLKLLRLWSPPEPETWDSAMYRSNQMVCVRLQSRASGKTFAVGNYHMPCMFKLQQVMVIHCALSAQHLQRFAKDDPYVFAGDFNIKPNSPMYNLLTMGSLPAEHPDYPVNKSGDDWKPVVQPPLASAYQVFFGAEPEFTNFAKVRDDPVFCDTLDYIFCSSHWLVNDCRSLPAAKDVAGPLPNETEYSDHILIAADLSVE